MFYKYNIGDLVLAKNKNTSEVAYMLHIHEREFKRFDVDTFPHKYYHGCAFSLTKDEKSGLYIPTYNINTVFNTTNPSTYNRENALAPINSAKVDLDKLFPNIINTVHQQQKHSGAI